MKFLLRIVPLLVCALVGLAPSLPLHAAPLYWDTNSTNLGAGATPSGTWGTNNFWNSDWTGGAGGSFTTTTTSADTAYLVAGPQIAFANSFTVTVSGTQSVNKIILDNVFNGSPTVTLSGGTLNFGGSTPTIGVFNNLGDVNITTVLAGSAGLTRVGPGSATTNLRAANTFTGGLAVRGGSLTLDFVNAAPASDLVVSSNTLTLNGGTLRMAGKSSTANTQTLGNVTLDVGGSSIAVTSGSGGSATLTLGNTWTRSAGGTVNFTLPSSGAINTSPTLASGILGPWATIGSGSSQRYATTSAGAIANYTGTAAAGPNNFTSATANYEFSAVGTLTASRTANTIRYAGTGGIISLGASGANDLTLNGILDAGSGTLTIERTGSSTGRVLIGATNELIIGGQGNVSITAPIANNGANASALTFNGSGILTLGGVNTFTGPLTISPSASSGGVSFSNVNQLGAGSVINLVGAGNSILRYSGGNTTLAKDINVYVGSSNVGFQITSGATTVTLSGAITNPHNDLAQLLLIPSNSNSGFNVTGLVSGGMKFAVNNGVHTISNNNNSYTGMTTVGGGGTLRFTSIADAGVNSSLGAGTTIRMNNGNTSFLDYIGLTNMASNRDFILSTPHSATLQNSTAGTTLALSGAISTYNATAAAGASLTFQGAGDFAVSGAISAIDTTITKAGTGKLTLSGSNSYIAATNVTGGVLNIQHANALGTTAGATTVSSGAALQIQGNLTTAAEALTLNGTGVSNTGALRNISGNNNVTGAITLGAATRINSDAGTLTLSSASAIAGTSSFALTVGGAGNTIIQSAINGTRTLTKDGAGTLTLTAANGYTGLTTISNGTLLVNNSHNGGAYTVNGGTLGGTGGIDTNGGNIVLSGAGKLSPGASAGTLTLGLEGGTLNLSAIGAGALIFEIGAIGASDQVVLTSGTLDIGSLRFDEFSFTALSGIQLGTYKLFDGVALTGAVDPFNDSGLFANGQWGGYIWSDGQDVMLTLDFTLVPEPSTLLLAVLGAVGLAWSARRRRRSR